MGHCWCCIQKQTLRNVVILLKRRREEMGVSYWQGDRGTASERRRREHGRLFHSVKIKVVETEGSGHENTQREETDTGD